MATMAALLQVGVEAKTAGAVADIRKFDSMLRRTDRTTATATARTSTLGKTTRTAGSHLRSAAGYAASAAAAYLSISQAKAAITTTQDLAKTTAGLNRNLGLSVKSASEWGAVAKSRDVDAKALTMSFTTLSRRLVDTAGALKEGGSAAQTAFAPFQRLGLSQQEVVKGSQNLSSFLPRLADAFGDAAGGAERQASAQQLLGRGYQSILPLFADGAKGLKEQQMWADKYGATLNNTTLKAQMDLIQAQRESKVAWLGIQVAFAKFLTPALEEANKQFQKIAAILGNDKLTNAEKFKKIGDIIAGWAQKAFDAFLGVFPKLVSTVGEHAPKVAAAFVKGFLQADAWGKLLIAGWLITKLGGLKALTGVGRKIGTPIGRGITLGITAALLLLDPAIRKQIGKTLDQVKEIITGELLGQSSREEFGQQLQDWFQTGFENIHFVGKNKVAVATQFGQLIFNAQTEKLVRAGSKKMEKFVGSTVQQIVTATDDQKFKNAFFGVGKSAQHNAEVIKKAADSVDGSSGKMADSLGQHGKQASDHLDHLGKVSAQVSRDTSSHMDKIKDGSVTALDRAMREFDSFSNNAGKNSKQSGQSFDRLGDKSNQLKARGSQSFQSLAGAVGQALTNITGNVNKSLKAFGVKQLGNIGFDVVTGFGGGGGTQNNQTGGVIVPGQGNGDKVPAMLEPGEVVWNKKAVAALGGANKANAVNSMIPRFQKGGKVNSGMAAMIAEANKFESHHFPYLWGGGHGGFGIQPVDCSGAVSDVLHAAGLLDAPMVSGSLAHWGQPAGGNEPLVVYANPEHTFMKLSGRFFGTSRSNPGGGAGWFEDPGAGYISGFAKRTMNVAGGAIREIRRAMIDGPKGPMRDLGQAAVDKVWKAANDYISKKAPAGAFGGGDAALGAYTGKLDKIFPAHSLANAAGHVQLTPEQTSGLASRAGLPGSTFEKIAHGESNYYPGVVSFDHGLGLWQITPTSAGMGGPGTAPYAHMQALGGESGMRNPWHNALMSKWLYDAAGGISPWHGTAFLQRGGIAKLAKGGKGGKKHGNAVDATIETSTAAPVGKLARMLKRITRLKGNEAGLQESFDTASTLAGFTTSPGGAELTGQEKFTEAVLAQNVLTNLLSERGLIKDVLPMLRKRKLDKPAKALEAELTRLQGVTGKSGDILTARTQLDQVLASEVAGASTGPQDLSPQLADALADLLRLANLRTAVSQAQYGVLGGMQQGGMAGVSASPAAPAMPANANVEVYLAPDGRSAQVVVNGKTFENKVQSATRGMGRRPLGSARGY